jgi:hypothetical protein
MNLRCLLFIGRLLAPVPSPAVASRSWYRRIVDWHECPRRIRLEMNFASDVGHPGPGLNRISRLLEERLSRSQACSSSLAPGPAIARCQRDRKRFRIESPVVVQHASS